MMTTTSMPLLLRDGIELSGDRDRTEIDSSLRPEALSTNKPLQPLKKFVQIVAYTFKGGTGDDVISVKRPEPLLTFGQALLLNPSPELEVVATVFTDPSDDAPHLVAVQWIKDNTGLPDRRVAELVGVTRQTLSAWKRKAPIANTKQQRVLAVKSILERAQKLYPTRARLQEWLDTPRGADGRTPAQLLASGDLDLARRLTLGTPSSKLKRLPGRSAQPLPERHSRQIESLDRPIPPDHDEELMAQFGDLDSDVGE